MKDNLGATNPMNRDLPPERQITTTNDLEYAVFEAIGMLDLFAARLSELERDGETKHGQPQWLTGVLFLSYGVRARLETTFAVHTEEVRRLQFLNL